MTTDSDHDSPRQGSSEPNSAAPWLPPRVSDRLDPERLIEKIREVAAQTRTMFPDRGLPDRLDALVGLTRDASRIANSIRGRSPLDFLLPALILCGMVSAGVLVATTIRLRVDVPASFLKLLGPLDAAANLAFLTIGLIFLLYRVLVEKRRKKVMRMLHRIRSLVHLLDMIQLTKNLEPEPKSNLSIADRIRYLDVCSQTASLAAKSAALLIGEYDDPTVVSAVTEIEVVCCGISQKIWSKIAVLRAQPA